MTRGGGVPGPGRTGPGVAAFSPSLVIFDCDGVLVDTEPITLRVMHRWLGDCGWSIGYDEVASRFKGTYLSIIERAMADEAGVRVDDFAGGYRKRMYAAFEAEGVEPVEGAVEVLAALEAAGLACCVGSNGPHEKMEASLTAADLAERLGGLKREGGTRIFSADDVPSPKPAPDLFLHAAAAMGFEPAACLVVEDSPSGVVAAKAAGMACIGLSGITPGERLATAGADRVIGRLTELLPLIGLASSVVR